MKPIPADAVVLAFLARMHIALSMVPGPVSAQQLPLIIIAFVVGSVTWAAWTSSRRGWRVLRWRRGFA